MSDDTSIEAAPEILTEFELDLSGEGDPTSAPSPPAEDAPLPVRVKVSADGRISICGSATIHYAALLYRELSRIECGGSKHVAIDLSELTGLDTAGAQILIALRRTCRASSVHSCPDGVRRFLELTGLTTLLTDEVQ